MSMTGERLWDPSEVARLEHDFHEGLYEVGEVRGGYGLLLSNAARLVLSDRERDYKLLPGFKTVDDIVEVTIRPDCIEMWDILDIEDDRARRLYFASIGSITDLRFLAVAAKNERRDGKTTGFVERAVGRAANVSSGFFDRGQLEMHAIELEEVKGLSGAKLMIEGLSAEEIQEINILRSAIGSALFVTGYTSEETEAFKEQAVENLRTELLKYEKTMLDFLDKITDPAKFVRLQSNQEQLRIKSFAQLLVAASTPA